MASRNGVRETPSALESLVSCVGEPGANSPRMIMARIRAAARSCRPVRLSLSVFRSATRLSSLCARVLPRFFGAFQFRPKNQMNTLSM